MENVTFQQIETFLSVAKWQNITRACEELYVSQPALSKTLLRFEENVGAQLFLRTNQGVVLTHTGKILYSRLRPIYQELDSTLKSVRNMTFPEERFLSLAIPAMYDYCDDFNPIRERIQAFKQDNPDIRVLETVFDIHKIQNALNTGLINIIIAPEYSLAKNVGITIRRIAEIPQYVTLSADHPLAQGDTLDIDALNQEIFLALPYTDSDFDRELCYSLCWQNGIAPKVVEFPPNYATVLHSIKNNHRVSITWKLNWESGGAGLKYYPLKKLDNPLYAVIAYHPDRLSRVEKHFVAMLTEKN